MVSENQKKDESNLVNCVREHNLLFFCLFVGGQFSLWACVIGCVGKEILVDQEEPSCYQTVLFLR